MKLKLLVLVVLAIAISLVGCGKSIPLEDTAWILESYGEQGNLKAVLPDTEVTATFKSAEGQVAGSAGCNSYGGSYELSGNSLSIPGPLMSTMMTCGDQIDQQEQQYLAALQSAESFKIENGKLTINCSNNILIFKQ